MQIKAIVFDFDGVIADSKSVKRDSWYRVFSDRSREDNELLQREVDSRIGDRYQILRRTLSALGAEGDELNRLVNHYADRYNELVQSGVRERGLFPGVPEMFERLRKKYPLYLNTTTPDAAIQKTAEEFGLKKYFRGIFGSSGTKEGNLKRVASELGLSPREILMVGDEEKDRIAALTVGAEFVGVADAMNQWSDINFPQPLLARTALLADYLEKNI